MKQQALQMNSKRLRVRVQALTPFGCFASASFNNFWKDSSAKAASSARCSDTAASTLYCGSPGAPRLLIGCSDALPGCKFGLFAGASVDPSLWLDRRQREGLVSLLRPWPIVP
eukprot:CAMPEP_0172862138 /NCGR_PEP_ID=MMETSP1075-20121228/73381_1 /TAXON_ID=2916 /ORGANISM="Ceratium fusus, Strain PA161109" /LENGTH=112 /DNA_ID=CAMNT_0013710397 /DNA_START=422 /DNA_END=761 /DNA_ORIENTATION=-